MVLTKISQHEASSTSKLTDHDIRQVPALSPRHHYKTKHFEIWKLMLYRCYQRSINVHAPGTPHPPPYPVPHDNHMVIRAQLLTDAHNF